MFNATHRVGKNIVVRIASGQSPKCRVSGSEGKMAQILKYVTQSHPKFTSICVYTEYGLSTVLYPWEHSGIKKKRI